MRKIYNPFLAVGYRVWSTVGNGVNKNSARVVRRLEITGSDNAILEPMRDFSMNKDSEKAVANTSLNKPNPNAYSRTQKLGKVGETDPNPSTLSESNLSPASEVNPFSVTAPNRQVCIILAHCMDIILVAITFNIANVSVKLSLDFRFTPHSVEGPSHEFPLVHGLILTPLSPDLTPFPPDVVQPVQPMDLSGISGSTSPLSPGYSNVYFLPYACIIWLFVM